MALNWQQYFIQYKSDPRLPIIVSVIFIVLLLMVFIQSVTQLLRLKPPVLFAGSAVSMSASSASISTWHLFGHYETILNNLPVTQLQLILRGTDVTNSTSIPSTAILEDMNKIAKVYKVGDLVPGGATLYKVFPHQVIFIHNGSYEVLKLPLPNLTEG